MKTNNDQNKTLIILPRQAKIVYKDKTFANFNSKDFLGLININPLKKQIAEIHLFQNTHGLEHTCFQAFFRDSPEGVSVYKPWPVVVISESFDYFDLGDLSSQYKDTKETIEILNNFDIAIKKEKEALVVA